MRRTELDAVATAHAIRRDFRVIYRGVRGPAHTVPGLRERIDAARLLYPSAVLCGFTAAALHGMAFTADMPVEIWLPARRSRAGIVVRCGAMPDEDVLEREAMLLTTPVRTGIDLARFIDGDGAIAAVDQAVRRDRYGRSMTTVDELAAYVASHPHLHRGRRVLQVLREVDGRAESPQETHVRLMLHRAGLPCSSRRSRSTVAAAGSISVRRTTWSRSNTTVETTAIPGNKHSTPRDGTAYGRTSTGTSS
ncbi:hypothetical protein FK529_04440 [Tsukamurella asaccharolytica]|uniref:AbiEi antitoxin C-terminal domain-containing protein n=1 Tax=Tsukamurella asaccharolytica TaxID=2592067 RepID=A0A5C5RBU7_9ACTN|nr:hypothetical protein [Tsukamurella asaccharolytica]TWS20597.1 hypothetical protein FK529_04440 [Tsukamurella asaccharolytica]